MTSPEKVDQQIDDALAALGAATPPDGMQSRLIRRVQRGAVRPTSLPQALFWKFAVPVCGLALFAGIAVTRHNAAISREQSILIPPLHTMALAPATHKPQKTKPHNIPNVSSHQKLTFLATGIPQQEVVRVGADATPGSAAEAEMLAPSQPAPPLPLSHQEHLLLAAAHPRPRPRGELVASLKRPVWPLHDSSDDADFQKFFEPPTSAIHEGDENDKAVATTQNP